jgi:hypothetical protein
LKPDAPGQTHAFQTHPSAAVLQSSCKAGAMFNPQLPGIAAIHSRINHSGMFRQRGNCECLTTDGKTGEIVGNLRCATAANWFTMLA